MYLNQMIMEKKCWDWAMGWKDDKPGARIHINGLMIMIKDKYCTDGLWNPDAELQYQMLEEALKVILG